MRAEEMSAHLGKYVFLVVEGDRSFPCDVLRVEGDEVIALETDHDEWPLSLRRVPLDRIVYAFQAHDVDRALQVIHLDDPDGMPWWTSKKLHGLMLSPADVFTCLRAKFNDETLLARPKKQKKGKAHTA